MAESISFVSTFKRSHNRSKFVTQSGNEWVVEEEWTVDENGTTQKIFIKSLDYFESNYYVDLEIRKNDSSAILHKSIRASSYNIRFEIAENEYSGFSEDDLGVSETTGEEKYNLKITLTPIFQFFNIKNPKEPKKRAKHDLLEGLKTQCQEISSILKEEDSADVVLYCGNKDKKAHSNILSARSLLFCSLFQYVTEHSETSESSFEGLNIEIVSDTKISKVNPFYKITMKDVHPSDFETFVTFIYTGRIGKISYQEAKDLLIAASSYGIHDLKRKCLMAMRLELSLITRWEIYELACSHQCENLQNFILDYIGKKIIEGAIDEHEKEAWMDILKKYQHRLDHIEEKLEKKRKHSEKYFNIKDVSILNIGSNDNCIIDKNDAIESGDANGWNSNNGTDHWGDNGGMDFRDRCNSNDGTDIWRRNSRIRDNKMGNRGMKYDTEDNKNSGTNCDTSGGDELTNNSSTTGEWNSSGANYEGKVNNRKDDSGDKKNGTNCDTSGGDESTNNSNIKDERNPSGVKNEGKVISSKDDSGDKRNGTNCDIHKTSDQSGEDECTNNSRTKDQRNLSGVNNEGKVISSKDDSGDKKNGANCDIHKTSDEFGEDEYTNNSRTKDQRNSIGVNNEGKVNNSKDENKSNRNDDAGKNDDKTRGHEFVKVSSQVLTVVLLLIYCSFISYNMRHLANRSK